MFFSNFNPKETTTFVPPLCQLQNDMKRGTSPSSNGWDFIPNTDGWDEVLMWKVVTNDITEQESEYFSFLFLLYLIIRDYILELM